MIDSFTWYFIHLSIFFKFWRFWTAAQNSRNFSDGKHLMNIQCHFQAVTNPLSDCPGQLKILLGNQKFKVLCPNGQLKSKQGTKCELKFWHYFWQFNRCVWHFIPKQVEGDSSNLFCRQYVPKRGYYKVLQAIF